MEDIIQNPKAGSSSNPIGEEFMVEVSIPEKIEIKMVDATSLNDYELWSVLTSVFCNFFIGFLVASISNTVEDKKLLYWIVTIIFFVFSIVFFFMTYKKRQSMNIRTKSVQLGVSKND